MLITNIVSLAHSDITGIPIRESAARSVICAEHGVSPTGPALNATTAMRSVDLHVCFQLQAHQGQVDHQAHQDHTHQQSLTHLDHHQGHQDHHQDHHQDLDHLVQAQA